MKWRAGNRRTWRVKVALPPPMMWKSWFTALFFGVFVKKSGSSVHWLESLGLSHFFVKKSKIRFFFHFPLVLGRFEKFLPLKVKSKCRF